MRVSTALIHNQGLQNILRQQEDLVRVQNEISTGKKIQSPSDDPNGAARIVDINEALSQIEQFGENANYATQQLNLEESTLTSANLVLQRVRELSIQAANTGVNDLESNQAIASEIKEKLGELFDYANVKDENGDYIFSGFQSKTQAFTTDGAGNYTYNGDEGQTAIQIGSSRQVTANNSGAEVFQMIRTGNGDFSVDVNRTNAGTGKISTGSVTDRTAFQSHDYTIRFIDADNYEVFDNTAGAVVGVTPRPYNDGSSITFEGIEVQISETPVAGDEFTVEASRYQDIFTTLSDLVRELETPGTGDITGSFGGGYLANGFTAGDAIGFDLDFDGITLNVAAVAGATDAATATSLTAGLVAAGVTDNLDGTFTLNGTTPGLSVTFSVNPTTSAIEFRTDGGNGEVFSNLNLSNLADTGNDGVMLLNNNGSNTVASVASITSAIVGDVGFFAAGGPSSTFLSQQIDNSLNNIDLAMDGIINVQTSIGGRINSIDSQLDDNEAKSVHLQGVRSEIQDLDLAEAISNMTFQTTNLQVAQQTFVRIQALSLFEFI
ncbi:MAG: flagellar hook-associated protein 3 [endosymbiont of Galathealinum brachiosum]|uniref:Flagellar hook-associated protein 3 n=1 Tax=endosymbiont of Galathealinum brachiosum TaxID=2200906 RepID=A0A370DJZ5_9GAMM|nr:MAG: flagellar hook-associated protein 3 [endosymbiont of Galathealinum brachiosum]